MSKDIFVTIGFLIQDVVDEIELYRMPQYREEWMHTNVCPFPETEEIVGRQRRLGSHRMLLLIRYRYRRSGTCTRCRSGTTDRFLSESQEVCSMAASANTQKEYANTAYKESKSVLKRIDDMARVLDDDKADKLLKKAQDQAEMCKEESDKATQAENHAATMCVDAASVDTKTMEKIKKEAESALKSATDAAKKSENILSDMQKEQTDMDNLYDKAGRPPLLAPSPISSTKASAQQALIVNVENPSSKPSYVPSLSPSVEPTGAPTTIPSETPSIALVEDPSSKPAIVPSSSPSVDPSGVPTTIPSESPSIAPVEDPSSKPTVVPSLSPSAESNGTLCLIPNKSSSTVTVEDPSSKPLSPQSSSPSMMPTQRLSELPSWFPSMTLSNNPSIMPSDSTLAPIAAAQAPPQGAYVTQMPSSAPSGLVAAATFQEDEFITRLSSNLGASNTDCEEVKTAVIQKTIAEQALLLSGAIYDEVMQMASGYDGNADVESIKMKAQAAHQKVQEEGAAAATAAELASEWCGQSQNPQMRRLQGAYEQLVQEEATVATQATQQAREALSEEKVSRNEMEELVSLIEFDPAMSQLEVAIEEDEALLKDHLNAVESEISHVDSQIEQLPAAAPKVVSLEKKRDSLVKEEIQIEDVLTNEEQFRLSQSALKKDEFYESVAPIFIAAPPLQYILRSSQHGTNLTVETNWDPEDETAGSKEEWFRRFGDMVASEVPKRLIKVYNTSTGGCITEDTDLSVVVIVTELETMWETFDQVQCSNKSIWVSDAPSEGSSELVNSKPSDSPSRFPSSTPSGVPSIEPSPSPSEPVLSHEPSDEPSSKPSARAAPVSVSIRITDTRDDGEEYRNSPAGGGSNRRPGHVDLTSSDLEFCREDTTGGARYLFVGLRFQSVDVPQGATIQNAYVSLSKDYAEYGSPPSSLSAAVDLTISGELPASGYASQFTDCPYDCKGKFASSQCNPASPVPCFDISRRANETVGTSNRVPWSIPASDLWSSPGRVQTPDISAIIQDIINSRSWQAKNALVINAFGSAALNDAGSRIARASDDCSGTFNCSPILELEYIPP